MSNTIQTLSTTNRWFSGDLNITNIVRDLEAHKSHIEKIIDPSCKETDHLIFGEVSKKVREDLCARKKTLEERLLQLNGSYYQDAASLIHQAFQAGKEVTVLIAERDQILKDLEETDSDLKIIESIRSLFKLKKADIELKKLCGEHYGDKSGLLDQVWRAFQQGMQPKQEYNELELRREQLERKKIALQPLCSDKKIEKEKACFRKYLKQEHQQTIEAIRCIQGLEAWSNEECDEGREVRIGIAKYIFECYIQKKATLNLVRLKLTSLPDSIGQLVNLKGLYLSYNELTTLPKSIDNLVNLERLFICWNKLKTLPESIDQLMNLKALSLTSNKLSTLPEGLSHLALLETLYLNANQLTTLPESFGRLTNLRELDLSHNELSILPESFGRLMELKSLSLAYNQFTTLPEILGRLVPLGVLDISFNGLTTLPASFGQLINLRILNLGNNQLTTLDENFGNLVLLEMLTLSHNKLTTLPQSIGLLASLKDLTLYHNQLTILPEGIGLLANMEELNLSNNQFTTLPESINQLRQLDILDLCDNQFTILPESIALLVNLKVLNVDRNPLKNPSENFGMLRNLKKLNSEVFLSVELGKIRLARKTAPLLTPSDYEHRIENPADLFDVLLIAFARSEFFKEPNFCHDISLHFNPAEDSKDHFPIDLIVRELTKLCALQKWEDLDPLLKKINAIKKPTKQKHALVRLSHFLGCCLIEGITPAQFSLILKSQTIQKLGRLNSKVGFIAIKEFLSNLKNFQADCAYRMTIKALVARLVTQGLSQQIALEMEQCLGSKHFEDTEVSLQLINLLSEWIDRASLRCESKTNLIGKRLVALLSVSDAGSLATTLEALVDILTIFDKDVFFLCIQCEKEHQALFLNQLQLFLGLENKENLERVYGTVSKHPREKRALTSYLKKIVQFPTPKKNKALEGLRAFFSHVRKVKPLNNPLSSEIAEKTAKIFQFTGFMQEEARDKNHPSHYNETVSEVQGTSLFCKEIMHIAGQTPAALSPEYLRNYERFDPTCLTLRHKRRGHVFNLKGKVHLLDGTTRNIVGGNETFFLPMLRAMFESFTSKRKDLISDPLRISIHNALSKAVWNDNVSDEKIEEIHKLIHDPEYTGSVIVGSGWDWHSTQLVFRRIERKLHIFCGNRGDDHQGKPGICISYIEEENRITPEFLKRVTSRMNFTKENYTSREKIQKELNAVEVSYIPMKTQKVGNCVLSSFKTVFLTLLHTEENAKKIYKELFHFEDMEILEDFLIELEELTLKQLRSTKYQHYLKGLLEQAEGIADWAKRQFKKDAMQPEIKELQNALQTIECFKLKLMIATS